MEHKQLDDAKTQLVVDSTAISHGSNLMALYTVYPEHLAPGNWLADTYWQIRGNIRFIYGTVEEAKTIFEKEGNFNSTYTWNYDPINNRYCLTTTAIPPFTKLGITRYIIAFATDKTIIDPEEPYSEHS
jgi:hypothetical protein